MKKLSVFVLLLISISVAGQPVNRTQLLHENIKTLQVKVDENPICLPVITLNGSEMLQISFDEMSHNIHSYPYSIKHCNADWSLSNLSSTEYIDGFTTGRIDDYALSVNTTFLYTHYRFQLPSNEIKWKLSGNYVVNIFEDNQQDDPIARVCFSVVDPRVQIEAAIRGNTDTELSGRLQQLDFDVLLNDYRVQDAQSEIKVVVRQNNRTDNQVTDIKPSYLAAGKLSYKNNRSLIFEGGNEYHRFDISSIYNYDEGVSAIDFVRPAYHAYLRQDQIIARNPYLTNPDVNGKFVINLQNASDDNTEADYMYVHFYLPVDAPFFDGKIYVGGEWNYNQMDKTSLMRYDSEHAMYYNTFLLKQGGYNYQYWLLTPGATKASVSAIDGSHWQTRNEYTIYVYHRPWGGRYDKLIGVKIL